MTISIIGGGNIGTLLAAEFGNKGHDVRVYSSKPEKWSRTLTVLSQNDEIVLETEHFQVSSSLSDTVKDADQIWITVPSFMFRSIAEELKDLVKPGQVLVVVPGSGGAEFAFKPEIDAGCVLCGLQRVHSIARLKEYGRSVYMLGRKPEVQIATIPQEATEACAGIIGALLDLPVVRLKNYLTNTLTPSNPILHTTRIYSMFSKEETFDHNILFYEEWTNEASRLMLACDDELQRVCEALKPLDMSGVISLRVHYESPTEERMTEKIRSIPAFRGLTSPMKQEGGNWVPDYFTSRYFTADFPYGLKIIIDVAGVAGVSVPNMEMVWEWFLSVTGIPEENYFHIPFATKEKLIEYYLK